MIRKVSVILFAAFAVFAGVSAAAGTPEPAAPEVRKHTAAEYSAAFAYFEASQLPQTQKNIMQLMLDSFTRSNPALVEFRPVMEEFFSRYLSYDVVKYDYADIYLEEFTVSELEELTRIAGTPVMKKFLAKQQKMMQAGNLIARRRLEPHQQEIRTALQEFIRRKKAGAGAPGAAPAAK